VWDGRFEIEARIRGLRVAPLAGRAARLPRMQRDSLKTLDPAVRPTLPVILSPDGGATCPVLDPDADVAARSLVAARLEGACGAISDEAAIWRVAKTPTNA